MRQILLAATLFFTALVPQSAALQTAEQMLCSEAVDYFEKNKLIYKLVVGKPLPIAIGVPTSERLAHQCTGRGKSWRSYWVETQDNPRCVVSVHCTN